MNLRTFIERPVLSAVISITIVVVGIIGLFSLPVEQYPDIAPPTIMVSTTYYGASAETLQKSVIAPLEEAINGVEDMTYMTSSATNSGSVSITVYFKQGTDPDMAAVNVQNRVSRATGQLPAEVTQVGVTTSNRPDVRSAEFSLAQAFYTTNAARAAFYPSITLSGSAGWTNSAGSMIVNPGKFLASAVASLTQPLFNKGANIAQLKIAKAQQEEARLSFEQTLLNAGVEVNEALVQYQTAREKADYYNKQVASLQTAAKSTSLLMKHGNTTYLEVLTAQQTLLNAQLSQVANRFTEIQGVITLYQALGGGRM